MLSEDNFRNFTVCSSPVILVIVCLFNSCNSQNVVSNDISNQENVFSNDFSGEEHVELIIISDSAFWEMNPPIEFFNLLQNEAKGKVYFIKLPPPSDWLKAIDTVWLNNFIESKTPASIVASYYESNLHAYEDTSSAGIQAQFLIKGFKANKYPPTLCSFHHFNQ